MAIISRNFKWNNISFALYQEMMEGEGNEKWAMAQKLLGSFIKCSESTCVCNILSIFHCFVTLLYKAPYFHFVFSFSCSIFFLLLFFLITTKCLHFYSHSIFFFFGRILLFVAEFIRCLSLSSSLILVSNGLDDSALLFHFIFFRDSVEHSERWTLTMCIVCLLQLNSIENIRETWDD